MVFFYFGSPPETTFYVSIVIIILCFIPQLWIVNKTIGLSIISYLKEVTLLMIIVSVISYILPLIIYENSAYGIMRFLQVSFTGMLSCLVTIYFFGLSNNERVMIKKYLNKKKFLLKSPLVF